MTIHCCTEGEWTDVLDHLTHSTMSVWHAASLLHLLQVMQ